MLPLVMVLAGCSEIAAPAPAPTAVAVLPTATPRVNPAPVPRARCADGRIVNGDLPAIDLEWTAGVQSAIERARAWHGDARLVSLQVGCMPLEAAFRWEGLFYSDSAQAFYSSDTGVSTPAEVDPAAVPQLPFDRLSFAMLHRSLAKAGYGETVTFSPTSGVTVRLNAPTDPFGPPGIPADIVYHVAVEDRGETRDLFVSAVDGVIYSYQNRE